MKLEEINVGDILIRQGQLFQVAKSPAPDAVHVDCYAWNGTCFSRRPDPVKGKEFAEIRIDNISGVIQVAKIE